jgi:DNA-binding transcriptional ArsR family regulator
VDSFAALAEPTRRRILDELRKRDRTVGELVEAVGMSQPAVSKHLRVLREAGLVSARPRAQTRRYRVEPRGLAEVDRWLEGYRRMWAGRLDELESNLDAKERQR